MVRQTKAYLVRPSVFRVFVRRIRLAPEHVWRASDAAFFWPLRHPFKEEFVQMVIFALN